MSCPDEYRQLHSDTLSRRALDAAQQRMLTQVERDLFRRVLAEPPVGEHNALVDPNGRMDCIAYALPLPHGVPSWPTDPIPDWRKCAESQLCADDTLG